MPLPTLSSIIPEKRPLLLLAPMQDVTDLPFWRIMHKYGGPDVYFTEYFRVYPNSHPEKHILSCIRENPAKRPVIAQMIGQDIPSLLRTAERLQEENILAIDLNMGCPAPIVCKKSSGGGLLRTLEHTDRILSELRNTIQIPFTVKTRVGFYETSEFPQLLQLFASHSINALTIHGRTVKEMYRAEVHFDLIRDAVATLKYPVFANGNILSAPTAREITDFTSAAGLMIGRGCIRNPWIWNQIRELYDTGVIHTRPTLLDLRAYIEDLYKETYPTGILEKQQVAKMKKYMNFIAQGLSPQDNFLKEIRRVQSERDFFTTCDRYLNSHDPFNPESAGKALINSGNPRDNCYAQEKRHS